MQTRQAAGKVQSAVSGPALAYPPQIDTQAGSGSHQPRKSAITRFSRWESELRRKFGGPFRLGDYLDATEDQQSSYELSKRRILITFLVTALITLGFVVVLYDQGGVGGHDVSHWVDPLVALVGIAGSIVTIAGFVVSLFIWDAAKRADIASQIMHNLAVRTSQSQAYLFSSFSEHIKWLKSNLSAAAFTSKRVELSIAISTPLYGVGSRVDSASAAAAIDCFRDVDIFLDWLEQWLDTFEGLPHGVQSTLNIVIWPEETHKQVFEQSLRRLPVTDLSQRFSRLVSLFRRADALSKIGKIAFNLNVSGPSDTRLFIVQSADEARGLKAVFTPLTESAIENQGWEVSGYSVWSPSGGAQMRHFFHALRKSDYSMKAVDVSQSWESAEAFLLKYFPMCSQP